ncbi:TPA: DEAD/DEAH box helicase [Vibrio parahaemolyticus]|nr:helicase-related protein [Vibrio parahaemolyticus]HCG5938572.1 DEAD/DEAH box helicase [Vibrio parahaemolyticus]
MNQSTYNKLVNNIEDVDFNNWDEFFITLVSEFNRSQSSKLIREVLYRLMVRKKDISSYLHIVSELFNEVGLFPYVQKEHKDLRKAIQHEVFKSPTESGYIFHIKQLEVFTRIANGENIILSAPTSFGKSLIIEAIVGSKKFNNIMVIVPSIALMDEARYNLSQYKDTYKIITQLSQSPGEKNVYIFTQERFLDLSNDIDLDFFIIDEFYKLHPTMSGDIERCSRLNSCLQKLLGLTNRFYMCGPNIRGLEENIESKLGCRLVTLNDYATVATNLDFFPVIETHEDSVTEREEEERRKKKLFEILEDSYDGEQTIIFCRSPQMSQKITRWIVERDSFLTKKKTSSFSSWLKEHYHEDWLLPKAIEYGVSFHHGKLPRALSSIIVDYFSKKMINILVCTSTLIEGVNTNAKNIIMFDTKINSNEIDLFTFNNIAGRSGRMLQHFVGNVYVIGRKPIEELPNVDIPIITQSENATESMLLDVPESNLTVDNLVKVSRYYQQELLPIELLRKHSGIEPEKLIELAKDIETNCGSWNPLMSWSSNKPNKKQLLHLCELVFNYFNAKSSNVTHSPKQLRTQIYNLIYQKTDKEQIESSFNYEFDNKEEKKKSAAESVREKWQEKGADEHVIQDKIDNRMKRYTPVDIDKIILGVFDFKRSFVGFKLPRIISAINDVQKHVFGNYGYKQGEYSHFSHELESFFDNPILQILEEFGIPTPLGKKLSSQLATFNSIDEVLNDLSILSADMERNNRLNEFEKIVLNRAISRL